MAAAVPFAMKAAPIAASALGGLFGKKAAQPLPQQTAAINASQQGVQNLQQTGTSLMGQGQSMLGNVAPAAGNAQAAYGQARGNLNTAGNYYSNILGGGRGATSAALAPERSAALD